MAECRQSSKQWNQVQWLSGEPNRSFHPNLNYKSTLVTEDVVENQVDIFKGTGVISSGSRCVVLVSVLLDAWSCHNNFTDLCFNLLIIVAFTIDLCPISVQNKTQHALAGDETFLCDNFPAAHCYNILCSLSHLISFVVRESSMAES